MKSIRVIIVLMSLFLINSCKSKTEGVETTKEKMMDVDKEEKEIIEGKIVDSINAKQKNILNHKKFVIMENATLKFSIEGGDIDRVYINGSKINFTPAIEITEPIILNDDGEFILEITQKSSTGIGWKFSIISILDYYGNPRGVLNNNIIGKKLIENYTIKTVEL